MNERIKKIRKDLNLTQDEFAAKINLSRNFIAQIEIGTKVPSDRTIKQICKEFNANEDWLRTGLGEPYIEASKDMQIASMLANIQRSGDDTFKYRLVSALAKLDESDWESLEKLIDAISGKQCKKQQQRY